MVPDPNNGKKMGDGILASVLLAASWRSQTILWIRTPTRKMAEGRIHVVLVQSCFHNCQILWDHWSTNQLSQFESSGGGGGVGNSLTVEISGSNRPRLQGRYDQKLRSLIPY